ncbi:MAG: PIN domain-containing protein [Actinobacteria bacterium]|nr:PIN domain-containing protein [Actinomycetota bacterium]
MDEQRAAALSWTRARLQAQTIAPTSEDFGDAAALAEEHHLTLYDAAYAAVARRRGAHLATLDRKLLRAGLGRRPSDLAAELPRT